MPLRFSRIPLTVCLSLVIALPSAHAQFRGKTIQTKRLREIPTENVIELFFCFSGCPLRFDRELDPGKGRWIFRKRSVEDRIEGVWSVEQNIETADTFITTVERSDRQCPEHPAVAAARFAGAVDVSSFGCSPPTFRIKAVYPKLCLDQTLDCQANQRRSSVILDDWDGLDDLSRGLPLIVDVPRAGPVTFTRKGGKSLAVLFELCCGLTEDYGLPGDDFQLSTYYTLRTPGGQCINETMRPAPSNPLPDVSEIGRECE